MDFHLAHQLLIVVSALFAGGIVMEALVDHPARLATAPEVAIKTMVQVLKRADPFMPILSVTGLVLGLVSYWKTGSHADLAAALLMGLAVPWTVLMILPINKRILASETSGTDAAELMPGMRTWLLCHYFRVIISMAALLVLAFNA